MRRTPEVDANGKPFPDCDRPLLEILLRPDGGTLEALNGAVTKPGKKPAWSTRTTQNGLREGSGAKKLLAEAMLDNAMLKDVASKKW